MRNDRLEAVERHVAGLLVEPAEKAKQLLGTEMAVLAATGSEPTDAASVEGTTRRYLRKVSVLALHIVGCFDEAGAHFYQGVDGAKRGGYDLWAIATSEQRNRAGQTADIFMTMVKDLFTGAIRDGISRLDPFNDQVQQTIAQDAASMEPVEGCPDLSDPDQTERAWKAEFREQLLDELILSLVIVPPSYIMIDKDDNPLSRRLREATETQLGAAGPGGEPMDPCIEAIRLSGIWNYAMHLWLADNGNIFGSGSTRQEKYVKRMKLVAWAAKRGINITPLIPGLRRPDDAILVAISEARLRKRLPRCWELSPELVNELSKDGRWSNDEIRRADLFVRASGGMFLPEAPGDEVGE